MSPTEVLHVQSVHTRTREAMQHDVNGDMKYRRASLTGHGRAWREDEEAYLVQSRVQKMPYKHIAAKLNKTELACRLHFHQLSHGSTRRRRSTSCSSGSSDSSRSQTGASWSPLYRAETRSRSPPPVVLSSGPYLPQPVSNDVQLPRIVCAGSSSQLPALFSKSSEGHAHPREHVVGEDWRRYRMKTPDSQQKPLPPFRSHRLGSPVSFQAAAQAAPAPALRLDTWRLPPPSSAVHTPAHVDLPRLGAIYEEHKSAFWAVVADEYGMNASPASLEQAWRSGACCKNSESYQSKSTLMTPVASPDKDRRAAHGVSTQDKTRISSIIDGDTS